MNRNSYWGGVWQQYKRRPLGLLGLSVLFIFCLIAIYAPLLASSKPLAVQYHGNWYFPLFRYLFYDGFFTKRLDLFYNVLIFTFPLFLWALLSRSKIVALLALSLQFFGFLALLFFPVKNPSVSGAFKAEGQFDWGEELSHMNEYAKLNRVLNFIQINENNQEVQKRTGITSTLWDEEQSQKELHPYYFEAREKWLVEESQSIRYRIMPLIRPFHWQENAGGNATINQKIPWWEMTRINRKDLTAALLFGTRISFVVGFVAVSLALLIGVPLGALAGYFGGTMDIILSRLLEIWESMPVFFMLLLIVAILESKSIFLVMAVIGLFSWTGFSRFLRGEFFKQRNLPYVDACRALGFSTPYIMFKHILPNAIPPLITLLPFAIMGAITGEAGLSFLGLGEEGSCSWGVLMDEGRNAFPAESGLLWPPAIMLTVLLIAIALVGDASRDAIDPKLRRD